MKSKKPAEKVIIIRHDKGGARGGTLHRVINTEATGRRWIRWHGKRTVEWNETDQTWVWHYPDKPKEVTEA